VASGEYRDSGLISSATGRPFQTAGGRDIYPSIRGKASALFHSLVANHAFHNGNKPTAVIAVDHFLLANAYLLMLDPEGMYILAKNVATYRAVGASHEDILERLMLEFGLYAVPFARLKRHFLDFEALYRELRHHRLEIRRHPLNRP